MILLLAAFALAQEPAFKADISLVEIDAVVIGRTGVVEGLGRNDFAIKDNRKPVTLRYAVQEQTPLDIVLAFENSRLMGKKLSELTIASEMAMAEFREGDRVAIMSAGPAARIIGDWKVPLPRPRDIAEVKHEKSFQDLHREIWTVLKAEVLKGYAQTEAVSPA